MDTKLETESDIRNWCKLEHFIEESLYKKKFNRYFVYKVVLSCEEIFVNICSYAYNDSVGSVNVKIVIGNKLIKITFIDKGIEFNPTIFENRNFGSGIIRKKPGGFGIFLAKKNMDEMKYERYNGKNVLTLIKNFGSDDIER